MSGITFDLCYGWVLLNISQSRAADILRLTQGPHRVRILNSVSDVIFKASAVRREKTSCRQHDIASKYRRPIFKGPNGIRNLSIHIKLRDDRDECLARPGNEIAYHDSEPGAGQTARYLARPDRSIADMRYRLYNYTQLVQV
ncbi:hypothetical protein ElyMa_001543800 [Elysia marginata]|uniref:Uncharacterized protein n=1 Tax=Elysia marginata TaxID=1093978 RepID=A0AAV4JAK0_9GAST|nr:hypothetical protein ElyMa_001543800 [Elysia marginata]